MEQLFAFGDVNRDPIERTVSVAYFALIDIHQYEEQINTDYHAEWFPIKNTPKLIFDHQKMVDMAKEKLKYKAAFHPILFELLPEKFTLPQLQSLFEGIFDSQFDKRNFSRKLQSTKLLIKQKDKDKECSTASWVPARHMASSRSPGSRKSFRSYRRTPSIRSRTCSLSITRRKKLIGF